MTASRREAAGLAGALLAHAALVAWLVRSPVPATAPVANAAKAADLEVDVAFEAAPSPVTAEPIGAAAAPVRAALGVARVPSTARDGPGASSEGASAPSPSDVPLDLRAPLALSADAIGLGGRNVFLGAVPDGVVEPVAPDAPPANVAPGVQQSVRDALHEHDHGIGLDVGGPVVAVAEELTRPSNTPLNSRAVFEVTADANGDVTGVSLLDASQGRSDWEHVATSLREALRTRKLRVPAGTAGLAMTLEVISRLQLPSGHDPDVEVSVLGIPVKKAPAESKRPQKVEIFKPEIKVVDAPRPPEGTPVVKLPEYQVQLVKILGLDVDPTDLTPRPLRVVHARIVREKVL